MTLPAGESPVARLPFQVRPQSGEGARAFIFRLAQANCLPPAYLRKYLTQPPLHRGSPTWDRIAAVAGRDPVELRQVLETIECEECGTPIRPMASFGVKPRTCSKACRQKRYRRRIPATDWKKIPCRVCGQLMRLRLGQRRHMCSSHCRRFAFQFRQRGEPLPRPPKSKEASEPADGDNFTSLCPVCEGPMNGSTGRKACSRRCSARIAHWTRSPLPPPTTCQGCQEPAMPRADGLPRRWCSSPCRQRATRRHEEVRAREQLTISADGRWPEPQAPKLPTCRGCHRSYQPLRPNPWCSDQCFEREILRQSHQLECAACGTSVAHRKPSIPARKWFSGSCQQRAVRWRAELRDRAAGGASDPTSPSQTMQ